MTPTQNKLRYHTILFDLDNTLFDYDLAEKFALEESFRGIGSTCTPKNREIYRRINSALWKEHEQGTVTKDELKVLRFSRLFDAIGIKTDAAAFAETYLRNLSKGTFLIDGALDVLDVLRKSGCRIAAVTNGLTAVQKPRMAASPVSGYMDAVIISEEAGVHKPEPAFFEHTFHVLGLTGKKGVLVAGDSLTSDIRGGINYGLDTCWYNPEDKEPDKDTIPTYMIKTLKELTDILCP